MSMLSQKNSKAPRVMLGLSFAALLASLVLIGCGSGSSSEVSSGASAPVVVAPPGPTLAVISAFASAAGTVTVTTPNTLSTGDVVIISGGSNNLNGTFTITAATPTTFSFASATIPTPGATGFWQSAGGPIAGCTTTNPGSPITLSKTESRVTGVAPLAVFFDAKGTTATTTTKPFHDLEFQWDFGDTNQASAPGGLTWAKGSRAGVSKRNEATGPVAAHVYETPGTYIVNLTIVNGTGADTVSNSCVQIAVTDPNTVFAGTNTVCVAATTMPVAGVGGCPAGAAVAMQSNFATVVSTLATTGKRVLLKRGDVFTTATNGIIGGTGPGILGAYGSGSDPIIRATAAPSVGMLMPSASNTPGRSDWRIMDLEFDGNGVANVIAIRPSGGINQLTILRVYAHDVTNAFFLNAFDLNAANVGFPGHTLWDQVAIVDSRTNNITGFSSALSIYLSAHRLMLLGNDLNNNSERVACTAAPPANPPCGGEHTVRLPSVVGAVISNNVMQGQNGTKQAFSLRAAVNGAGGVEGGLDTQYVVVSDNKFVGGAGAVGSSSGSDMTTYYGPQATVDERVADTITERNWYVAGGGAVGTQAALQLQVHREQTIRNNIFDTSGGRAHGGIKVLSTGAVIIPDQIRIYHNTFFSNDVDNDFLAVSLQSTNVTNVTVRNNLAYAPSDTQHHMLQCGGSSSLVACAGLVASNNSSNAQVLSTLPGFTIPPVTTADWKPTTGYAIGTNNGCTGAPCATTVPVWSDFFRVAQPAIRDLGAVIH